MQFGLQHSEISGPEKDCEIDQRYLSQEILGPICSGPICSKIKTTQSLINARNTTKVRRHSLSSADNNSVVKTLAEAVVRGWAVEALAGPRTPVAKTSVEALVQGMLLEARAEQADSAKRP